MAGLIVLVNSVLLLLFGSDIFLVGAMDRGEAGVYLQQSTGRRRGTPWTDRPPAPVNVSVMHLRADSATVSWEVPEGDIIIGFSISQQ
ncbi:hypothetical protein GOODEAATRI_018243, partial [Goodea atripinnis]